MAKGISIWVGAVLTVVLMVAALWAWRFAPELAMQNTHSPYVAKLGIRSLALALAAGAQVILLTFVIAKIYEPRWFDRLLSIAVTVLGGAALGTAVVLALTSR